MAIQKEVLRQIIKENDLKSVGDVSALLKESFKDLFQKLLEAELDVSLGCNAKYTVGSKSIDGRRKNIPELGFGQRPRKKKDASCICNAKI